MRLWMAIAVMFIILLAGLRPAFAVEYCPIKVIAVSKLDCDKGLTYVGPLNKFKYGGYCIYPLRSCLAKVEISAKPTCTAQEGGKYVGARLANRYGGHCMYPSPGWKVETRQVSDIKECKAPDIYLGPAKAGELGGHCVRVMK